MGMTGILVMWPKQRVYIFFFHLPEGCICNLIKIGPVVSEKTAFANVDRWQTNDL